MSRDGVGVKEIIRCRAELDGRAIDEEISVNLYLLAMLTSCALVGLTTVVDAAEPAHAVHRALHPTVKVG